MLISKREVHGTFILSHASLAGSYFLSGGVGAPLTFTLTHIHTRIHQRVGHDCHDWHISMAIASKQKLVKSLLLFMQDNTILCTLWSVVSYLPSKTIY